MILRFTLSNVKSGFDEQKHWNVTQKKIRNVRGHCPIIGFFYAPEISEHTGILNVLKISANIEKKPHKGTHKEWNMLKYINHTGAQKSLVQQEQDCV